MDTALFAMTTWGSVMHSPSSYQSLIDNLSREDRQKAQDDLAKRFGHGGVDSETWFKLRGLFQALTKGEEHEHKS
jgi:hypothetical protein